MLIAVDLIDMLESGGFEVLGPLSTVAAAVGFLKEHRPDACVLDVNLRGQHSTPVAAALKALNVPFVLSSAYGSETLDRYPEFAGVTNVGKPAPAMLASLIAALVEAP